MSHNPCLSEIAEIAIPTLNLIGKFQNIINECLNFSFVIGDISVFKRLLYSKYFHIPNMCMLLYICYTYSHIKVGLCLKTLVTHLALVHVTHTCVILV